MRDQGGSGAASTRRSSRRTPYARPAISAADHPRRSRRGLRSGHSPDPSIVRPADAPQPLLPGAHPPFLDSPLPLTGPDAPVLNRVEPPLPLTGPDAPLLDRVDPPLPLTGPDAPVLDRVLDRVDPPLLLTGPDAPIIDFVDPPLDPTSPYSFYFYRYEPPFPLTGPKLGLFSVDAPMFNRPKAPYIPVATEEPSKSCLSAPLGPPEPDNPKYVQFSREPIICLICNKVRNHMLPRCPFMLLATRVFEEDPPEYFEYLSYFARYEDLAGISGFGFAEYNKEELELITAEAERITAEAARLRQEDGLNLVKISELPKEKSDAEKLYNAIKIYGPVTHVLTFPEHRFGFVGFVRVKDAESAIRESNLSGCYGHLTFG